MKHTTQPTAVIVLPAGFEEMEAVAPIDLLRRAGVLVSVQTIEDELLVTGRNEITLKADLRWNPGHALMADLLILPGGPGHTRLKGHAELLEILRRRHADGKLIAAICAAPMVLAAAGILPGPAFTSHPSTSSDLSERDPDLPVVISGNLITSQGAGTATRFALALVEMLCGAEKMQEIADSISY